MNLKDALSRTLIATRQIITNRLTIIGLCIGVAFWIFVAPFDQNLPLFLVRILLIGISASIALSYLVPTLRQIQSGDYGGVTQWLVGVVFYFTSVCAASLYSVTWYGMDRPDWMATYPLLTFIILSQALGALLVLISPSAGKGGFPVQNVSMAVVIALLVGILLGAIGGRAIGADDVGGHTSFGESFCGEKTWWGNIRRDHGVEKRVYHGPKSPYRAQTMPEDCFWTEDEAKAAGFRPPG